MKKVNWDHHIPGMAQCRMYVGSPMPGAHNRANKTTKGATAKSKAVRASRPQSRQELWDDLIAKSRAANRHHREGHAWENLVADQDKGKDKDAFKGKGKGKRKSPDKGKDKSKDKGKSKDKSKVKGKGKGKGR